MDMHERLKEARIRAGWSSAMSAAQAYGWPVSTYLGHENGQNNYKVDTAKRYARAYKTTAAWLLTGDSADRPIERIAPVVGYVNAGGEVITETCGEVELPPGAPDDTEALVVRGDALFPIAEDGWHVYYSRSENPLSAVGKLSVVGLMDGRTVIKRLQPGRRPGYFDLVAANAAPVLDIAVQWAARISWIKPS